MRDYPWLHLATVAVAGVLWYFVGGWGGIGEFSPYTLEYRSRSELTFCGIPVYRSPWRSHLHELSQFLESEKFVVPVTPTQQRWERLFHWNSPCYGRSRRGKGRLYNVVCRGRSGVMEWSREHRKRAEYFWSEGFRLLRSDRINEQRAGAAILNGAWRFDSDQQFQDYIASLKAEYDLAP